MQRGSINVAIGDSVWVFIILPGFSSMIITPCVLTIVYAHAPYPRLRYAMSRPAADME